MNNKGIGAIFCLISAVLMSARYIAAAIFMSNVSSWDSSLFQAGLSYVGSPLKFQPLLRSSQEFASWDMEYSEISKSRTNEAQIPLIEENMDYTNEQYFVQKFIGKALRARLLYELTTPEI